MKAFSQREAAPYLQMQIEFSQKQHVGVEFLLNLRLPFNSYVPLLILYSTSTTDHNHCFKITP